MKQRASDIIGWIAKIDFPELDAFDIPAKVDTGADVSALWASDIEITPKGLQFVLFDKSSRFYTGQQHLTAEYRTKTVRSSSGEAQLRYMVKLLVQLNGRRIRAWFTLADRARMRYPILLGKRLLKGKFVVDVSESRFGPDRPAQVLFLTSGTGERVRTFADKLQAQIKTQAEITVRPYTNLAFDIAPNNVRLYETDTGKDLAGFDLVYFKTHRKYYEFAATAAQYLNAKDVVFIDQELTTHIAYDKLSEMLTLALAGLPVPPTYCAKSDVLRGQYDTLVERFGSKLVCKEINADRGNKNYLIEDRQSFERVMTAAESNDTFLVQPFIENDGYMRAYVFGSHVELCIKRSTVAHEDPLKQHLNNPSGSKNAQLIDTERIPSEVYDIAVRACKHMNRQIAGVDLIQNKHTKEWFVLEANSAPQLMSGSFTAEKQTALAKFIDFELNR